MARHDLRYRGPEEGLDANLMYHLNIDSIRWTGHVTRTPDKRPPQKELYGERQEEKCSKVANRNATMTPQKHRIKILIFKLILRRGPHRIEQSRVASLEREHQHVNQREFVQLKESVTNCKPEPRDYHHSCYFSELSCSICNQQLRAEKQIVIFILIT